jgi:hypothetical protein
MKTRKNRKYTAGQVVQYAIHSQLHFNWNPLYVHNMDCGPNCFCLLGYASWETSNKMALRTPGGITGDEVIMILNDAYGTKHEWVHIQTDRYKKIKDYLHLNEATFASIGTDDLAHYFVVVRDKLGLYVIDAQSGEFGPLKDYIRFMEDKGFAKNTFYIVSSRHTLTHANEFEKVTMKLVKKYFPMKNELWGVESENEPDRVLTKLERRQQRKILQAKGYGTSPDSSLDSSVNSSLNSSVSSKDEWTLPTSRSRAGRRAKSERTYKSKTKKSVKVDF